MTTDEIVQVVQNATAEVFSTMLSLVVEPKAILIAQACPPMNDEVMALLSLSGAWAGSGVLTCSSTFACRVCEKFFMTEAVSVNEEVLDAIGELANMIIGNFKTAAEGFFGALALSIPTVVYGKNFTYKSVGSKNWIVMPFSCGNDTFEVRVWFAPS